MEKTKKVQFRISEDDLAIIDRAAANNNVNRTQYIIHKALEPSSNDYIVNKNQMMEHLTKLSNYINDLQESDEKNYLKEEVFGIWQSLKS